MDRSASLGRPSADSNLPVGSKVSRYWHSKSCDEFLLGIEELDLDDHNLNFSNNQQPTCPPDAYRHPGGCDDSVTPRNGVATSRYPTAPPHGRLSSSTAPSGRRPMAAPLSGQR
eukprot:Selendium_serpulae@DN3210_c1_g1_i3.p1